MCLHEEKRKSKKGNFGEKAEEECIPNKFIIDNGKFVISPRFSCRSSEHQKMQCFRTGYDDVSNDDVSSFFCVMKNYSTSG